VFATPVNILVLSNALICLYSSESSGGSFRSCDVSLGNACFVTGAVGLLMSSCVVNAVGWGPAGCPAQGQNGAKVIVRPRQLGKSLSTQAANSKVILEASQHGEEGDCSCGMQSASLTREVGVESADMTARNRQEQEHSINVLIRTCKVNTPLAPLFDAHCHLQLPPLSAHASAALALASSLNVSRVSVCGTAPGEDWQRVRTLYDTNPTSVFPSFGLHPWFVSSHLAGGDEATQHSNWEGQLESLLLQIPTAGVGECGLDKAAKTKVDNSVQEQILRAHISLAVKHQRILTLHCVPGCWDRLLQILTVPVQQKKKKHDASACTSGSFIC
jgi:hypothetical protein